MDGNELGTLFIAGGVVALAAALLLPLVAMIRSLAERTQAARAHAHADPGH